MLCSLPPSSDLISIILWAYSALTSIIKHHRHQQWLQKCLVFPLLMLFVPALLAPSLSQRTALMVVIEESSSLDGTSLLCERRHDISLLLCLVCFVSVASLIHPFYDAHLVSALQPPILRRFWCSVPYNTHYNISIICKPKPQQTYFMMYFRDCQLSHTAFLLTPACPGNYVFHLLCF